MQGGGWGEIGGGLVWPAVVLSIGVWRHGVVGVGWVCVVVLVVVVAQVGGLPIHLQLALAQAKTSPSCASSQVSRNDS